MKFGSVASGIEAASMAWNPLGWDAQFVSEIEPFPCEVLKHHHPHVPNLGDMLKFKDWPDATIDVLVGGTPCQSFSVAGLRKGMDDPRGNLMLTYLAIAARYSPPLAGLGECPRSFVIGKRKGLWFPPRGYGRTRVWVLLQRS